jgi:hypothetical protein
VNLATDFYTLEEVKKAHGILSKFVKQRLPLHKGSDKDKAKKTISDLLKVSIDPVVTLPVFYAVNISRLPAIGIEHVDVVSLFQELVMLRNEVRSIASLRSELADATARLQELVAVRSEVRSLSTVRDELSVLKADVKSVQASHSTLNAELCDLKANIKSSVNTNESAQDLKTCSNPGAPPQLGARGATGPPTRNSGGAR